MNAKPKPHAKTVRAGIRASVPDGKLRKARIILTEDGFAQGSIGGFTAYEREHGGDVVRLGAPQADTAYGVTVRGHETRHASRHKPQRRKPMSENGALASQIVDDVNIETTPVPETKSERAYRRAHLTVGIKDLRKLKTATRQMKFNPVLNTVRARNWNLMLAVRATAMCDHYGDTARYVVGYGTQRLDDCERVRNRALRDIQGIVGRSTMAAIKKVIAMAHKKRGRNRAIGMLEALMEKELTPEQEEREEEDLKRTEPDMEGILAPVTEGGALDGDMRITQLLPRNVPCSKEKSVSIVHAPDGVIINPTRYVNAICSGNASGLFSRHVKQKSGGVILIDASSSMHANAHNLTALCELAPTATVAYYSGFGARGRGELVVYALAGKRFGKELPQKTIHGGNAVDLPAIRWMMRLPKPWTLISDLGFCGGVLGAEQVAFAIVEREQKLGHLTVHRSLDAAYEAFGGKGELRNA